MKYYNVTLKDYLSNGLSALNSEELKEKVSRKASNLIKFHPSNKPKDLDLANLSKGCQN